MTSSRDWRPRAAAEILKKRARLLEEIRTFMRDREILEVETPILNPGGNPEPHLQSLVTRLNATTSDKGTALYLHTSPEFGMKRLLASGSGSIYQICKVFRDAETGRYHQPEFTMLEWYRVGFDQHDLMDEIDELLVVLGSSAARRVTYNEVFHQYTGLDAHAAGDDVLLRKAQELGLSAANADRSLLLDFLFSSQVAPRLGRAGPCFVHDFPACQAALARIRRENGTELAERFELFINGIEIANGYNELTSYSEQESRFEQDNRRRMDLGLPAIPWDPDLIAALRAGMPDCAGVALGIDRLLMVLAGVDALEDVLTFPLT